MARSGTQKNPTWFYVALGCNTLLIILIIGLLRDLMWIL